MNYKRHKPKEHRRIDCCRDESWYDSGNSKYRYCISDRKRLESTEQQLFPQVIHSGSKVD